MFSKRRVKALLAFILIYTDDRNGGVWQYEKGMFKKEYKLILFQTHNSVTICNVS